MARNSCIAHPPRFPFLILRPEYLLLTEDSISAKLLAHFEFLTDCKLGPEGDPNGLWLGACRTADMRAGLVAEATEHYIRDRLDYLIDQGFLSRRGNTFNSDGYDYRFNVKRVQSCLDAAIAFLRSNDHGYDLDLLITALRSFSKSGLDQKIEALRSNDRSSLYKTYREFKKENRDHVASPSEATRTQQKSASLNDPDTLPRNESQPSVESEVTPEKRQGTAKGKKSSRRRKSEAERFPDDFNAWWRQYRDFCASVQSSVTMTQNRFEAVAEWDKLFESGVDLADVVEGSAWYFEVKRGEFDRKGEAIGVAHGSRFLKNGTWLNALEHKRSIQSGTAPTTEGGLVTRADAELRQNYLPQMSTDERLAALQPYGTVSYSDLTEAQKIELWQKLSSGRAA